MKRDEYVEKLKKQLDQWNDEISYLENRAEQMQADAKDDYDQHIKDLRQQSREAQAKLHEIQKAHIHAWDDLRAGAEQIWHAMEESFKRTSSRFGK